jgi:hypothetical protein
MLRVRVTISGWTGGPGLSTFYFTDATSGFAEAGHCVTRVHNALLNAPSIFPAGVVLQVQPNVDIMNPVDGEITGTFTTAGVAPINGSGAVGSTLPAATALVVRLDTQTYNAGRRLQGRLFLSPVSSANMTSDGNPGVSILGLGIQIADSLNDTGITSPLPVIWRRPRLAKPLAVPPVTARDGSTGRITTGSCKPVFGVLRSRRD